MRLEIGEKYVGEVTSIEPYGAVLKFDDNTTHLLHISHISDQFISNVGDYIQVGDKLEVFALPGKVKPVELTIRESEIDNYTQDDRSFGEMLEDYLPNDKDIRYKDRYSNQRNNKRRGGSRGKRK